MRYLYGIAHNNRFAFVTNKREVKRYLRANPNATARRLSWGYYRDTGYCMDYPTFYAVSDPL